MRRMQMIPRLSWNLRQRSAGGSGSKIGFPDPIARPSLTQATNPPHIVSKFYCNESQPEGVSAERRPKFIRGQLCRYHSSLRALTPIRAIQMRQTS